MSAFLSLVKTCLSGPLEALGARFPFVVALWYILLAQTVLLKFYSEELEVPVSTLKFTRYITKLFFVCFKPKAPVTSLIQ